MGGVGQFVPPTNLPKYPTAGPKQEPTFVRGGVRRAQLRPAPKLISIAECSLSPAHQFVASEAACEGRYYCAAAVFVCSCALAGSTRGIAAINRCVYSCCGLAKICPVTPDSTISP